MRSRIIYASYVAIILGAASVAASPLPADAEDEVPVRMNAAIRVGLYINPEDQTPLDADWETRSAAVYAMCIAGHVCLGVEGSGSDEKIVESKPKPYKSARTRLDERKQPTKKGKELVDTEFYVSLGVGVKWSRWNHPPTRENLIQALKDIQKLKEDYSKTMVFGQGKPFILAALAYLRSEGALSRTSEHYPATYKKLYENTATLLDALKAEPTSEAFKKIKNDLDQQRKRRENPPETSSSDPSHHARIPPLPATANNNQFSADASLNPSIENLIQTGASVDPSIKNLIQTGASVDPSIKNLLDEEGR
ncbi:hypothetical protein EV361DRAFT_869447 [Lentinula raphanica]|uniref:Uncharacterized protein n=1 Tax=Lentinula raphanica TaxID=153919 RepID=A0AA38UCE4_9AGAR|nr:hypothetical protein F5880DRAFT_1502543 [Lentinula raphanica]KAJ3836415.1 hypothetical protein F5878DRAFT_643564 [Lentinula raphanica]KAJ3970245.1 hypothetical protein EV361DRAFT_869447 [Lentinula raphanica]